MAVGLEYSRWIPVASAIARGRSGVDGAQAGAMEAEAWNDRFWGRTTRARPPSEERGVCEAGSTYNCRSRTGNSCPREPWGGWAVSADPSFSWGSERGRIQPPTGERKVRAPTHPVQRVGRQPKWGLTLSLRTVDTTNNAIPLMRHPFSAPRREVYGKIKNKIKIGNHQAGCYTKRGKLG